MRVQFQTGQQRTFLDNLLLATHQSTATLATRIGIHPRTFRDWRREKWQMDDASLNRLCKLANLPRPEGITLLPEHWSVPKASRIGGRRRFELYGSPGTPEGRSRGGRNSQKVFRANPEYYRLRGVAARKTINMPPLSANLAEFVGIVLGDGTISHRQVTVSCNMLDAGHAEYIKSLVPLIFGIQAGLAIDQQDHTISVVISSTELVEHLTNSLGLKKGDKVRQQVDVPSWIWQQPDFQISCLRGLMDTDGCVFRHTYRVNGKVYAYTKLAFTNYSRPLLFSAKRLFEGLRLFPTIHTYDGHRLYLHDTQAVKRYFEIVGTHNPRYRGRFEQFSRNRMQHQQRKRGEVAERSIATHC